MENVDLIINDRWIVPVNQENQVLEHHCVVINDGRIVDLIPQQQASQNYQAATVHKFEHHCLMPGLINNHTPSPMSLFRGLADDMGLWV